MILIRLIKFLPFALLLCFCNNEPKITDNANKPVNKKETLIKPYTQLSDEKGFNGIYIVGDMLAFSKTDSAAGEKIGQKIQNAMQLLSKQLLAFNKNFNSNFGLITYNENVNNIVFQLILPIDSMPKTKPKNCDVIVLYKDTMLVYNHYGSYKGIKNAYNNIDQKLATLNLKKKKLPIEFYITDVTTEPDSAKWLTRIMVPVSF